MSWRVMQHIGFWLAYITMNVVILLQFAPSSDLEYPFLQRTLRFFFRELAFLPWQIIPFYFLFYFLIPKYFRKGEYLKISIYLAGAIIVCLFGLRTMISPVQHIMYGEVPEFNVYSLKRFMFSLTDILPAFALGSAVKLLRGRIASDKKEATLRKEKQASELQFLKAQANPHFLFNTLNNLYGLARKKDDNTAPSIMKLSNIMRYILNEGSQDQISIESEVKVIEDFIELEKLRYDDQLHVKFEKKIDNWQQPIAPLILLPFIENAFKHGASENRFETVIDVLLALKDDRLNFRVVNSVDSDHPNAIERTGLKNIKRQLDLIYNNRYKLNIFPEKGVFIVELSINLDGASI
ncbi:MAG: sensor histidine kinase [Bacteroidota bacterium]